MIVNSLEDRLIIIEIGNISRFLCEIFSSSWGFHVYQSSTTWTIGRTEQFYKETITAAAANTSHPLLSPQSSHQIFPINPSFLFVRRNFLDIYVECCNSFVIKISCQVLRFLTSWGLVIKTTPLHLGSTSVWNGWSHGLIWGKNWRLFRKHNKKEAIWIKYLSYSQFFQFWEALDFFYFEIMKIMWG